MPWAMVGEVIDEDDLAHGERREGLYNGVFTFLRKLGGALGVFLVLGVLDLAGFVKSEAGAAERERAPGDPLADGGGALRLPARRRVVRAGLPARARGATRASSRPSTRGRAGRRGREGPLPAAPRRAAPGPAGGRAAPTTRCAR